MPNDSRPRFSSRLSMSFKKIFRSSSENLHDTHHHRTSDFRVPSVYVNTQQELLERRKRHEEALRRVPRIPWAAILDWVLRPPLGEKEVNVIIQEAKAAERTRLNLRRVCRAWKSHADGIICFLDVAELVNRSQPLEPARIARVISCRQKPDGKGPSARALLEAMEAILSEQTQIEVIRLFSEVSAPDDPPQYMVLNNFNPSWTRLRYLKLGSFFSAKDLTPTGAGLGLPTVQHLEYVHDGPGFLHGHGWWLPALRTLRIGLVNTKDEFETLLTVLKSIGSELTFLEIIRTYPPPPLSISASLWQLCPKLQTFSANFCSLEFEESPPLNSPLRHVIDTGNSMEKSAVTVRAITELYWPSLHKVTVPITTWANELPLNRLEQKTGGKAIIELSVALSGRGIRLEDRAGLTMVEVGRHNAGRSHTSLTHRAHRSTIHSASFLSTLPDHGPRPVSYYN